MAACSAEGGGTEGAAAGLCIAAAGANPAPHYGREAQTPAGSCHGDLLAGAVGGQTPVGTPQTLGHHLRLPVS